MVTKLHLFLHAKAIVERKNPDIGGFNLPMEGFDRQINRLVANISVPLYQQLQQQECLTLKKVSYDYTTFRFVS